MSPNTAVNDFMSDSIKMQRLQIQKDVSVVVEHLRSNNLSTQNQLIEFTKEMIIKIEDEELKQMLELYLEKFESGWRMYKGEWITTRYYRPKQNRMT